MRLQEIVKATVTDKVIIIISFGDDAWRQSAFALDTDHKELWTVTYIVYHCSSGTPWALSCTECTTVPSRCLMDCSPTEPMLMEMMSLLARFPGPEAPPWTSSDWFHNNLHPVSSLSHTDSGCTWGGMQERGTSCLAIQEISFSPCDAACSCFPFLKGRINLGLKQLLITDMGRWRWQKRF